MSRNETLQGGGSWLTVERCSDRVMLMSQSPELVCGLLQSPGYGSTMLGHAKFRAIVAAERLQRSLCLIRGSKCPMSLGVRLVVIGARLELSRDGAMVVRGPRRRDSCLERRLFPRGARANGEGREKRISSHRTA